MRRAFFGVLPAVAAITAFGVSLPSHAATGHGSACFNVDQMQNSRLVSHRTLLIRLHGGAVYEMDFGADCDVLDSTMVLHPVSNMGDICSPVSVNVSSRGGGGMCIPTRLRRLTPDEVAAIPHKDLP